MADPYRQPAERERGPRWGATRIARWNVRLFRWWYGGRVAAALRRIDRALLRMQTINEQDMRAIERLIAAAEQASHAEEKRP